MVKKHILDCDEQTWRDIKRFKLDYLDDANINDALIVLIKRGMVRSIDAQMLEAPAPVETPHRIAKSKPRGAPWSPEKTEKMRKEMREKYGVELPV